MLISLRTPKENFFIFGESFEKILLVYLDIAKFILGLAAGGIVLVIGSSTFGQSKALPSGYASPLFLLGVRPRIAFESCFSSPEANCKHSPSEFTP